MPLKVKAIIDAIKGTPLCSSQLTMSTEQNSLHCVMGELLHKVGATNRQLQDIDDESDGLYWDVQGFQKFKPALKRKFGIECSKDVQSLVKLNDEFSRSEDDITKEEKDRTCHIMTTLVKKEARRLKKETRNAQL